MEKSIAQRLREHLSNISDEEFRKEWLEIESLGLQGPAVAEYVPILENAKIRTKSYVSFEGTNDYFTAFAGEYNFAMAA